MIIGISVIERGPAVVSGEIVSSATAMAAPYGPPGPSISATSSTPVVVTASGSKTFVVNEYYRSFSPGIRLRATDESSEWVEGVVTSFDAGTRTLILTADLASGSGTQSDWNINVAGQPAFGVTAATAAEYAANSAPSKMLTSGAVWTATNYVSVSDGSGTITCDLSVGFDFFVGMSGAGRTMAAPANAKVGQKGIIYLNQDATGGRTITTWNAAWKFSGGIKPTLTTAGGGLDIVSYVVLTTSIVFCTFSADLK